MPSTGEIMLYKGAGVSSGVHVRLDGETVWLSLNQMAQLFGVDKSGVSRHMKNIYKSGELKPKTTVANFATVLPDGRRYGVEYYNLDMIISVGYRVNSKEGTKFRMWAANVLREHVVHGYTLNQRRLKDVRQKDLQKLIKTVGMIRAAADAKALTGDEATGLLRVIADYAETWATLHKFDEGQLGFKVKTTKKLRDFEEREAHNAILALGENLRKKGDAGEFFGKENGSGLASILRNLHQTFDGTPLYMSIEERAAHLLYFVIKDHPFIDGNKRIGSLLFVLFLKRHGKLLKGGERRISDSALVAIALLIARSKPEEKETMIALVENLL